MQIETSRGGITHFAMFCHFEMPKLKLFPTLNRKAIWPCSSQMKALEENSQMLIGSDKKISGCFEIVKNEMSGPISLYGTYKMKKKTMVQGLRVNTSTYSFLL
jgi:hypothetical protein